MTEQLLQDDGVSNAHSHLHSHDEPASPRSDEEGTHLASIQATFDMYRSKALSANQRRRAHFFSLPVEQQQLLSDHPALLNSVDECIERNASFLRAVIDTNVFPPPTDASLSAPAPTEADHERLRSTLRQVVRDWATEGESERNGAYEPILEALRTHFPGDGRSSVQVLVPGAGLGRLAFEIWRAGFTCQANEFSMFMLIISAYMLNFTEEPDQWAIHPYIHSFNSIRTKADLLRPITVPDIAPHSVGELKGDFSFAAGDFLEVYNKPESYGMWDVVATAFFIDTARNIVDYLTLIYKLLMPGGLWINNGPTLWHFENANDGSSSIELTVEQVKQLASKIGFVLSEEKEIETLYASNPLSTLRHEYSVSFWIARKI